MSFLRKGKLKLLLPIAKPKLPQPALQPQHAPQPKLPPQRAGHLEVLDEGVAVAHLLFQPQPHRPHPAVVGVVLAAEVEDQALVSGVGVAPVEDQAAVVAVNPPKDAPPLPLLEALAVTEVVLLEAVAEVRSLRKDLLRRRRLLQ